MKNNIIDACIGFLGCTIVYLSQALPIVISLATLVLIVIRADVALKERKLKKQELENKDEKD